MNKPIDRWDTSSFTAGTSKNGYWVKYSDHQELLQGLLKSILDKRTVFPSGFIGLKIEDIKQAFKSVGIE